MSMWGSSGTTNVPETIKCSATNVPVATTRVLYKSTGPEEI